jgi:hypothetical protein
MSLHEHSEEQTKHLQHLTTESSNPSLIDLDAKSILERLEIMNSEDVKVALAIKAELPHIAEAVKSIVSSFRCGGRLIYIGAGSSGRLGVLDAAEYLPEGPPQCLKPLKELKTTPLQAQQPLTAPQSARTTR